jgi:hypothetical protein
MVDRVHRTAFEGIRSGQDTAVMRAADRIATWTSARYEWDAGAFQKAYSPVGIMPPDKYLSVLVQATEGCSWNRCSFCDFYAGKPFRIRNREELGVHIQNVRSFFGEGIGLRRSIFLGDGNALSAQWETITDMFDCLKVGFPDTLPGPSWRKTGAFVDVWGGRRLTSDQMVNLKEMGLHRVYLGLETGHDPLLARLNKRGSAESAIDLVRRFRQAGVSVGIIVMLGLGGHAYSRDHVWDTVRTLQMMSLGSGDIVYYSPLETGSHLQYTQDMWAANIKALSQDEMMAQYGAMVSGLDMREGDRPKVALYPIRRFIY